MHPDNRSRTYYVIVTRRGDGAYPFCWEIQRRRKKWASRSPALAIALIGLLRVLEVKRWINFWTMFRRRPNKPLTRAVDGEGRSEMTAPRREANRENER